MEAIDGEVFMNVRVPNVQRDGYRAAAMEAWDLVGACMDEVETEMSLEWCEKHPVAYMHLVGIVAGVAVKWAPVVTEVSEVPE